MSSYSCRTAYGKRGNRLSQHARANALDIRGFETSNGIRTALLADWGPRRRFRAKSRTIAAIKDAGYRSASGRRQRQRRNIGSATGWTTTINAPGTNNGWLQNTPAHGPIAANQALIETSLLRSLFGFKGQMTDNKEHGAAISASLFPDMSNLGRPRGRRQQKPGPRIDKAAFLRAIHGRACAIFGTVLGPDANYAHRHHFHLDLQQRRLGPFCR